MYRPSENENEGHVHQDLVIHIPVDEDPLSFFLARELILDEEFLNRPVVQAQRIRREYLKQCKMFPSVLHPWQP